MKARIIHQAFEKDAREVRRVIRRQFPEARIASGCPADVRGLSDVDILVFREGAAEQRLQRRIAGREVNILVTGDAARKRALQHREFELREMRERISRMDSVVQLKRSGVNTEMAWVKALDFTLLAGEDEFTCVAQAQEGTPRTPLLAGGREYPFH